MQAAIAVLRDARRTARKRFGRCWTGFAENGDTVHKQTIADDYPKRNFFTSLQPLASLRPLFYAAIVEMGPDILTVRFLQPLRWGW